MQLLQRSIACRQTTCRSPTTQWSEQMKTSTPKREYETPNLEAHGSIEQITQGASTGTALDATFPTGTPFGDLTFS
jgi:hypothetical protein